MRRLILPLNRAQAIDAAMKRWPDLSTAQPRMSYDDCAVSAPYVNVMLRMLAAHLDFNGRFAVTTQTTVQRKEMYRIIRRILDKRSGVSLTISDEAIDDMCRREMVNRLAEDDESARKEIDALLNPEVTKKPTRTSGKAREERYIWFFDQVIERLVALGFSSRSPLGRHHYSFSAGHGLSSSIEYSCVFKRGGEACVDFYIGWLDKTYNKTLFDNLHSQKDEIEERFGSELLWQRLDKNVASRIRVQPIKASIDDDDQSLERVRDWMVDQISNLDRGLGQSLEVFSAIG